MMEIVYYLNMSMMQNTVRNNKSIRKMIKFLWQDTLSKLLQHPCKLVQRCLQEAAHLLVSMPTVSPHSAQLHHVCSVLRKFSTANTSSAGAWS